MIVAIASGVVGVVGVAAGFYGGSKYGASGVAAAVADFLKVKSAASAEYTKVIADIKANTSAVLAKLKSLL